MRAENLRKMIHEENLVQVMYHLCSKSKIPMKGKYFQPFRLNCTKIGFWCYANWNNTFRAFIEVKSFIFHQSKLLLFSSFLFSSEPDHTTFTDLLLVNEARRYEKTSFSLLKGRSQPAMHILPSSTLFSKHFEEYQGDFRTR